MRIVDPAVDGVLQDVPFAHLDISGWAFAWRGDRLVVLGDHVDGFGHPTGMVAVVDYDPGGGHVGRAPRER